MITIPRHATDHGLAQKQVEALAAKEGVAAKIARDNFDQLYFAHSLAVMHAAFRSVVDPEARTAEIWTSIVLAAHAGTGIFALAATEGGGADLVIGQPVHVPAKGSTLHLDPLTWVNVHNLAVVCRDKKLLDVLCAVPVSAMRRPGSSSDEFAFLWVDALQSYWRREPDVLGKLNTALEATGAEKSVMPKAMALQCYYPTMKLFHYLARQEAEGVNSTLAEALQSHKKYWGQKSRANNPDGLLALGPLAMACIAYDLEIELAVESEYVPRGLLEGVRVGE
ncbi:immunity 49 family protein [Saccharothrix deserti]|uniref:immunity 49 family protein n=1 Tax=Saccharothrix deserti TaxID=2593674 RepID=UPI00131B78AC|nr:immunity 49 family protein [Saccharothrix deserti]